MSAFVYMWGVRIAFLVYFFKRPWSRDLGLTQTPTIVRGAALDCIWFTFVYTFLISYNFTDCTIYRFAIIILYYIYARGMFLFSSYRFSTSKYLIFHRTTNIRFYYFNLVLPDAAERITFLQSIRKSKSLINYFKRIIIINVCQIQF